MKSNTAPLYYYMGDYYGYTNVITPGGVPVTTYSLVPIKFNMSLSVNLLGELVFDSLTKLQLSGNVKNVVDRNGEQIYEDGGWQIIQTAPILGPLGIKGGYRYRAKMTSGNI